MKKSVSELLRIGAVLFGFAALVFLLWEPHFEGRNANATVFEVYFKDPFLAYVYVGSIPFFVGLFHGLRVLGFVGEDRGFSAESVGAVRKIRLCALALLGFVAGSVGFMPWEGPEDRPPGVFLRLLVAVPAALVAVGARRFERLALARARGGDGVHS